LLDAFPILIFLKKLLLFFSLKQLFLHALPLLWDSFSLQQE
jgi:hypothetical protein